MCLVSVKIHIYEYDGTCDMSPLTLQSPLSILPLRLKRYRLPKNAPFSG
jgi:hypothetical protein